VLVVVTVGLHFQQDPGVDCGFEFLCRLRDGVIIFDEDYFEGLLRNGLVPQIVQDMQALPDSPIQENQAKPRTGFRTLPEYSHGPLARFRSVAVNKCAKASGSLNKRSSMCTECLSIMPKMDRSQHIQNA